MTLVFLTNFMNHHQVHIADEFYKILGDGYKFVATEPMPESFIKNGYPIYERSYIVKAYDSKEQLDIAYAIAEKSDVAIIGSASEDFLKKRLEANKLTFHYSERLFKTGYKWLISPRFWRSLYKNHLRFRNRRSYMLCASAFTAKDVNLVGAYRNKCFKWGYFAKVDNQSIEEIQQLKQSNTDGIIRLMWCSRFLKWKHPELPVKLAARLKRKGYTFEVNMFGSGEELEKTQNLSKQLGVNDVVNFCGNLPNDSILQKMREHDIFLFTSDRNEGWGAVLNEAMSNGCAVVASNKIGSVPYLIQDSINGMIYKSENINSLVRKVVRLLDNPQLIKRLSSAAIDTMQNTWSPENAANRFLLLVRAIQENDETLIPKAGPCSKAK